MGLFEETVWLIVCDNEECEDTLEDEFGDAHFFDAAIASDYARSLGWEFVGTDRYKDAYCKNCAQKRKHAAEGKPELPEEIPGQISIFPEVAP